MAARRLGGSALCASLGTTASLEAQAAGSRLPGTMTIGRLHYDGGGDWYANPSSLPNLLAAIASRTSLRVAPKERVVTLSSDDLWDVPYIHMTGHGNVHFSDQDLERLRRYLRQGGFSMRTTTTAWTSPSGENWLGSSPIIPWSRCR
jgi:hypothetical protein